MMALSIERLRALEGVLLCPRYKSRLQVALQLRNFTASSYKVTLFLYPLMHV